MPLDAQGPLEPACPGLGGRVRRVGWAAAALFWTGVFGWLWLGAPWLGRVLGAAWFALGLASPMGYLYSLALALPWFGNNPGGVHHLYLLEMGLAGLVVRHLALAAAGRADRRPGPLDFWIILFVVYSWVTLLPQWRWFYCELMANGPSNFLYRIYNHYGTAPVFGLQMALKLTLSVGFYATVRDMDWTPTRLRRLWGALVGALSLSAAAGLLTYFDLMSLAWWRGENPYITLFGYRRLQSLYWHSGWYVQYVVALAPAALWLALAGRDARRKGLGWGLTAVLTVTALLTFQRAGWIALAGGYACVIALVAWDAWRAGADESFPTGAPARRRWAGPLAVVVLLAGSAAVLGASIPAFRERLMSLANAQDRLIIWRSAWELTKFTPITGAGFGNYYRMHCLHFPQGHPFWGLDKVASHNTFIHILAERGVVGLALWLALLGTLAWGVAGALRRRMATGTESWLLPVAVAGLAALLTDGLFQYIFYLRVVDLLFWWMVAMAVVAARARGGAFAVPPAARGRTTCAVAALMVLAAVGVELRENAWWIQDPVWVGWQEHEFIMGGPRVELQPPAGAGRVQLDLTCLDPGDLSEPFVVEVRSGDRLLATTSFTGWNIRRLVLDLKSAGAMDQPLVLTASRSWTPFYFPAFYDKPVLHAAIYYKPLTIPAPTEPTGQRDLYTPPAVQP